ncbi:MAG TPA: Hsp20/alpha crystallin family protein, partial [Polyangia bacterium]
MANIAVQRKDANETAVARREWDPFRMMRDMLRWDPFREMAPAIPLDAAGFSPAFEVKETKESFVFKADVPGIK